MIRLRVFAILLCFLSVGAFLASHGASRSEAGAVRAIKNLPGCAASNIPANDDGSSDLVDLPFTLNFFGTEYSSLYVNNNGNVTFDSSLPTYTPFSLLETTRVIIAPFFADIDTRADGSGLTTFGATTFSGRPTFCVNWLNVGYYRQHSDKLNSIQLLLVDRSDVGAGDFDIVMNYGQVQWETGDASGGTNGLGGSSARAGYSNGVDTSFELTGSAVNGAFLDSSGSGLVHSSRGTVIPGRYVFNVRNGAAPLGGAVEGVVRGDPAGQISGSTAGIVGAPLAGAVVQICPGGAPPCIVTTTNADGVYHFDGLPTGPYNAAAWPPAGWNLVPGLRGPISVVSPDTTTGQDIFLGHPGPLPNGVTIATIGTMPTGTPVIHWGTSVPFSVANCPGGSAGHWDLIKNGVIIQSGSLSESPPGTYSGKIMPLQPQHGYAVLHITIDCPSGPDKDLSVDVYIDPSGTVKDTHGAPISGATVTLFHSDSAVGPFDAVPDGSALMSPSNRNNPDTTGADGVFHWDVVSGFYKVRAEKQGCHAPGNAAQAFVETSVKEIPPPAAGLELTLECAGGQPTATFTPTSQGPPPTPTRTPAPPTPTPQGLTGDANCDHNVNSIDAAVVLQYVAGLVGTLPCLGLADANRNGSVNSIDSAVILQYVAGLIAQL